METKALSVEGKKAAQEILDLVIGVANAVPAVLQDGKVDLNDLSTLLKLVPKIGPAIEGFGGVKAIKDLEEQDVQDLVVYVAGQLVITNPKARIYVDSGLKMAQKAYEMYKLVVDMKEQIAAIPAEPVAAIPSTVAQ